MIDPTFPLPGENELATQGRAIQTIIDEVNLSSGTIDSLGQQYLKKVNTTVVSIASGDYSPVAGQWYNQTVLKPVNIGLPYDPIALVVATIKGSNYVLPYMEFDSAGSIVGFVGLNPYQNTSFVFASWLSQTPAITAYFTTYSQAATANN